MCLSTGMQVQTLVQGSVRVRDCVRECVRAIEIEKESKQTFPIGRTQFCSVEALIPLFQSNSADKNRNFETLGHCHYPHFSHM